MKLLLSLLVIAPFFTSAQNCKLHRDTDPYTKETKLSTGFIQLQGGALTIDADSKEINYFFAVGDKCFTDASTVFIFFEGSRAKMTYRNSGSMNCEGNFHFTFRNGASTPGMLQKLGTRKVAHFIFTGSDKKEVTVSLLPDQQQALMDLTNCIINEGKTLVK